jgi:polar amino acid transport system substrate-binding protein
VRHVGAKQTLRYASVGSNTRSAGGSLDNCFGGIRMKRALIAVVTTICVLFGLCGCTIPGLGVVAPSKATEPVLTPVVSPPTILSDGVLKVGLDYSYAPFAGETDGQVVGIDADVAAALAQEMGLTVEFVNVGSDGGPNAVSNGTCDIFLNFEKETSKNSACKYVGTYIYDAPSLFVVSDEGTAPKIDTSNIGNVKIAAQANSVSAAQVVQMYGSSKLTETKNLVDAFGTLESGSVKYVAASAIVGSYIATSYPDIVFGAALTTPSEIGIGVSSTNTQLQAAVSTALSTITKNGVLDIVISKWIGAPLDLKSSSVSTSKTSTS